MQSQQSSDVVIVGGGMVGLSIAWQLLENGLKTSISIIEKENQVGKHCSGRNSGILHAGIYYEPNSLKSKVCIGGAKRLKLWCEEEKVPILECGKIITPQKIELDSQLEILLKRGQDNGAVVELIDERQFYEIMPDGRTSTGRALWSPGTSVVKPRIVVEQLKKRLEQRGVDFIMGAKVARVSRAENKITLADRSVHSYGRIINCAGLHADRIAHLFGIGKRYIMLPFKGEYYQLREDAPFNINSNLYPVPDLEMPFLGVHATPSLDGVTYLGPTATPALGRENYSGINEIDPSVITDFIYNFSKLLVKDKRIRNYAQRQILEWLPNNFLGAAKELVPKLKIEHIKKSSKVGIRPQLYDTEDNCLIQDFVMLTGKDSIHVINAISPAFTASFELADYILKSTNIIP